MVPKLGGGNFMFVHGQRERSDKFRKVNSWFWGIGSRDAVLTTNVAIEK